ncbi:MAG: serine/threonine-protein kinase, partial [Myxococcota bacterium]|nr:serine/threonine-protein kinase [Myxococcota bacterium]
MDADSLIGLVIDDKYKLDRKIGEGGMGAVYLGTQLMVDRNVAIKLLHTGLSGHDRIKQRFEVEAKAIGRMNHPNCITLYDFGISAELDAFYMVMEYLDGTPMHRRVVEGVSAKEAVDITRQIALALDHAHHQKILHRDLKPENVMLTQMTDGTQLVKVLDFGIARIFQQDEEPKTTQEQNRLTRAGEVFGTPAYISPEQARGDRDLTPASDLYSLGVMLYEMLQGELPFWGETAIDTIMKHITSPVPRITRIDLPGELKELTYQLLSKDPSERPQSGKELGERLAAISFEPRRQVPVGAMAGGMGGMGAMGGGSLGPAMGSNLSQEFPFVPDNATIADMPMTGPELNEWATAEATVVQQAGGSRQTPPPQVHVTTPPHQALRPPNFSDSSSSDLHLAPRPATQITPYDENLKSSRPAWLIPALLVLGGILIAGGLFTFKDSQANQVEETQTDQSIADKTNATSPNKVAGDDNPTETAPPVDDKNDIVKTPPKETTPSEKEGEK